MPPGLVDAFQACPFEENLHIQDVLHLKWPREALETPTGAGKSRMAWGGGSYLLSVVFSGAISRVTARIVSVVGSVACGPPAEKPVKFLTPDQEGNNLAERGSA